MKSLIKTGYQKENIVSYGNMFLIGNGHLGYRGTLEEYNSSHFVGLNVCGFYDRYKKLWRESVNAPNPFYIKIKNKIENCSVFETNPIHHQVELVLKHALFKRFTEFKTLTISSERFISSTEDNLLCEKYKVQAKEDQEIEIICGTDIDIWEINGPHFKKKKVRANHKNIIFVGKTNEEKYLKMDNRYLFEGFDVEYNKNGMFILRASLKKNEVRNIYIFSKIIENCSDFEKVNRYNVADYKKLKALHCEKFEKKFINARVTIVGDKEAQFELDYSIYHLLILENENYNHSIPARGLSGQTYKGAIFWDTEIFMLPFYTLTNPKMARNLIEYRIKTLDGALEKAKKYGYEGAFYPWESQEGKEMCSKYQVTDVFTNKPIRTYFNEKQIHISADVVYGIINYVNCTHDFSVLKDGGLNVMIEVFKFFKSYSKFKSGQYHIYDVIGPDEYHERVKDNAFTNYMIHYCCVKTLEYLNKEENIELYEEIEEFKDKLYLPPIAKRSKLIEQFKNFFKLEKTTVEEIRSRLRHPSEYWGTKNGVAANAQIIKQADVITLLALLPQYFTKEVEIKNYNYYYPITEHGSSLSASMYSLIACKIKKKHDAYSMFRKSAGIDLGTDQKIFAGGIYIGGTHPASNGGAYLSAVFGFCGLTIKDDHFEANPHLPSSIKQISFNAILQGKKYNIEVSKFKTRIEEIQYEI